MWSISSLWNANYIQCIVSDSTLLFKACSNKLADSFLRFIVCFCKISVLFMELFTCYLDVRFLLRVAVCAQSESVLQGNLLWLSVFTSSTDSKIKSYTRHVYRFHLLLNSYLKYRLFVMTAKQALKFPFLYTLTTQYREVHFNKVLPEGFLLFFTLFLWINRDVL